MVDLKTETTKAILEKLSSDAQAEDILNYLFEKDLLDKKRCRHALVKRCYFNLLKDNPDLKNLDAKQITAEDFGVSMSQVDKSLYYYTKVEL
jgi:hypothetical protein